MRRVLDRVFVGSQEDCRTSRPGFSVVHTCKVPCHRRALGYRGRLPRDHPGYLFVEAGDELFLNLIDPDRPLFHLAVFVRFLDFAAQRLAAGDSLLVHCNLGRSRAPSLVLLLLAKRCGVLPNTSYDAAVEAFLDLLPGYRPRRGIQAFLRQHWTEI